MTKNQRTLLHKLEPLGYRATGYDRRGHLVVQHPEAGYVSIAGTPGNHRDTVNTLLEAKRRLRFARSHHAQFLQYLYEKFEILPGETKIVEMNAQSLLREYLDTNQVTCDRKQFHSVYENARRNMTCMRRGANGQWKIQRPAEPKVQHPYAAERDSAALAPVAPKGTPLPVIAPKAASDAGKAPDADLGGLSPVVVAELRRVLELPDDRERLVLAQSTASQLADRIEADARHVVAELRALASLLAV
jgi:hypothetical protein